MIGHVLERPAMFGRGGQAGTDREALAWSGAHDVKVPVVDVAALGFSVRRLAGSRFVAL
ncbi:hypothetical protein [Streptomyces sp. NBC_01508]|uniref:hypothetical protein n=1 Tax=Streptomyces sp. NBC_01508 TaxID=2903888 RepID=UPI002F916875